MVDLGASCIGEVGTGIDAHYSDTILLPMAIKTKTGLANELISRLEKLL